MDDIGKAALDAFEKGKKDSYIPQDPFVAFGFESNPFPKTPIAELRKEKFLRSRITKISAYIGKVYSSNIERKDNFPRDPADDVLDGVLYCSSHSGITTLLRFTQHLLKKHSNIIYADAKELVTFDNYQYYIANSIQNFRNFIGKYDFIENSSSLVIIDHADYLVGFFETFRDAFERDFPDIPIIFIFTYSGWTRLKNELAFSNYDIYNRSIQSIHIDSLNSSELAQILTLKLSKDGSIQNPFSNDIINLIAQLSFSNLDNAIKICVKLCEECFYNGYDTASKKLVKDIIAFLRLDFSREFYNLITLKDNTQTEVLSLIAMKSIANDTGATYEEIVNNSVEINSKTSAAHHLKQLEEKQYILKKTVNRRAFYRLREELKTLADSHLLPRFEQREGYLRLERISDLL